MAPVLAESQHAQIHDMNLDDRPTAKIANDVGCSQRSVFANCDKVQYPLFWLHQSPFEWRRTAPKHYTPEVRRAVRIFAREAWFIPR
jgi:hypothetical protein